MKRRTLIALIVTGLSVGAHAAIITLNITGTGSGSLDGVGFTDKTFDWQMQYDTESVLNGGTMQPIFTNLMSSFISLQDVELPINVTQDHGLYVDFSFPSLYFIPMKMSGGSPAGDIFDVNDWAKPVWNGTSAYSASGGIVSSTWEQFTDIATDQGVLNMTSGSVSSVVAAIPEPATMGLFGSFGCGIFVMRRIFTS